MKVTLIPEGSGLHSNIYKPGLTFTVLLVMLLITSSIRFLSVTLGSKGSRSERRDLTYQVTPRSNQELRRRRYNPVIQKTLIRQRLSLKLKTQHRSQKILTSPSVRNRFMSSLRVVIN